MKKLYFTLLISIITGSAALAQSVDVNFSGLGFLDNREYKDFVARSRTYSGMRTELDFGLNIDSLNHFIVGANGIHEFGAVPFFLKVNPVAYYKFKSNTWQFMAGEFPRVGLLDNYPRALLNDTLQYYRPNVEGLLAKYQTSHFMETGWIDWVSRQTDTAREQFLFGFEGKYKPSLTGPFYIVHYFLLEHNAGAAILRPDDHIQDNGGGQVKLGLDFSHKQKAFDSLTFEAGVMISMERTRGVDGLQTPKGFIASAYGSFSRFAIFDEFYAGQGSHVNFGDSFYEKKFYNRLDLIFNTFVYKGLRGKFVLSVHRTPGYTSNQEAFNISYDLGRRVIGRFKD
ncbi:hypothetical protein [Mucilaginibacter gotjawali]|uniref:Phosphate-selective porin O and P n=1 Tax=Mucilaginibacter gotjawali TaxID=1550579 RepID=A0A839SCB7_9SPHI|nr:hypothetical protein [Mucilaginibacter gotjawali]MBB3054903.1 hypothetical protein [Mucilaginibacter gotjawali]